MVRWVCSVVSCNGPCQVVASRVPPEKLWNAAPALMIVVPWRVLSSASVPASSVIVPAFSALFDCMKSVALDAFRTTLPTVSLSVSSTV